MIAADGKQYAAAAIVRGISRSVGAKLFTVVLFVLLLNLGLLGFVNVRLHQKHLEAQSLRAAERMGNVISRSVGESMMRNDRAALREIIATVGREPDIVRVRLFNREGTVAFSSAGKEVGSKVLLSDPQCVACHIPQGSMAPLTPVSRFHSIETPTHRELGVITPIYNSRSCSEAACHAHASNQKVLGVLETNLSLADADANLALARRQFISYSILAILLTLVSTGIFVWRFVHRPATQLRAGTEHLAKGELGYQIAVESNDELGALAKSFNGMSKQLAEANTELASWARTLEQRVGEKTAELHRATDQMIQAEKLTSLGKLAAVVAHEINNPLSGILTYARLMRKWVERGDSLEQRGGEMRESLQLIESESRRCGDIVQNLLMFARVPPLNIETVDVNTIIRRTVKLVEHRLELGNIVPTLALDDTNPRVRGDANQLEQLLLALVMNAIDAMPHEGNLRLTTSADPESEFIRITVEDDGIGIPDNILSRMFDPFVTTKEEKGVGLGLAVSRSIVERHRGHISVKSQVGVGTTFTIEIPVGSPLPADQVEAVASTAGR